MPSNFGLAVTVAVLPDVILVALAAVCALLGALRPGERPTLYRWIACIGLAGAVAASGFELYGMRLNKSGVGLDLYGGGLVADHMSVYVTVLACALAFVVCLLSDTYLRRIRGRSASFFALVLISTASVSAIAGEHDMITLFVALQALVISLGLISLLTKTDEAAVETSLKLLLEGGAAAAVLLYGLAILYGVTGSADLARVGPAAAHAPLLVALGTTMVVVGLSFPAGVLPFRRWVRRSAQHVPAIAGGYVLTMGLLGGGTAWLRVGVSGFAVGGLRIWVVITAIVIATSTLYAGLASLRESNVRRLVAQLASLQSALVVLGVLAYAGNAGKVAPQGAVAALLALALFSVGLIAVFAVLGMLETAGVGSEIDDLRGLGQRSAPSALLLALALSSLVGLPPLAGFFARILVLESAVGAELGWLVLVVLLATLLSAVGVARLVAGMYAEPRDERPFTVRATPLLSRSVAVACCVGVFLLGVITQPLLALASGGAGPLL